MKIRAITCFIDPGRPVHPERFSQAGRFVALARSAFERGGYPVQSVRLATVPFAHYLPRLDPGEASDFAVQLEALALANGFEYLSIGPALPGLLDSYRVIPRMLEAAPSVFASGLMTTSEEVSLPAVRACAEIIHQAATISPDGFANLRFAATAHLLPGAPFFPAAYHAGDAPEFALAMEAADLAVEAFTQAETLSQARQALIAALERHGNRLAGIAQSIAADSNLRFGGIDFTMAPFPSDAVSLGAAIERLGVSRVGLHGTLAAAAIVADTLDRAQFQRAGFCGLLLPVLEDSVLARRAAEGSLTITDLLLYSAVCGTGLDTIPLPGATTVEEIEAVLLDVACLAQRLGKPLTARLLPIPGKKAGEMTSFDFPYFANSRILSVRAAPLTRYFAGDETIYLKPRIH